MAKKMLPFLSSELEENETRGCVVPGGWLSRTSYGGLRIGSGKEGPEDGVELEIEPGLKRALIDAVNYLLAEEE